MAVPVSDFLPVDPPGQLQVVVSQRGSIATIVLGGEWDIAAKAATREAFHEALAPGPGRVVLDLSHLDFMDSTGVHAAIELRELAAQQNARLEIIPGSQAVQRPFEICQFSDKLPFRPIS